MDIIKKTSYQCGKCHKVYVDENMANNCCEPYHCNVCGKETPRYVLVCEQCREKREYNKAQKMTLQEWEEKFPNHMIYYNDKFYGDIYEMLDDIDFDYNEFPAYCWGTDEVAMEVDPDNVLEGIVENTSCEDLDFSDEAYKEFKNIISYWNDKYRQHYYMQSDIIVLIPEELKKEYIS